ncbi:MAG: hypothetical protein QOK29_1584 [Rhodospirillaceae bacterium]|jgi:hypothetical protein|nr:hypothetical protein [Rhodospirillaceae bacterium]
MKTSLIFAAVLALAVVSPAVAKQQANGSHAAAAHVNTGAHFNQGTKDAGGQPNSQVDEEKVAPYVPH